MILNTRTKVPIYILKMSHNISQISVCFALVSVDSKLQANSIKSQVNLRQMHRMSSRFQVTGPFEKSATRVLESHISAKCSCPTFNRVRVKLKFETRILTMDDPKMTLNSTRSMDAQLCSSSTPDSKISPSFCTIASHF